MNIPRTTFVAARRVLAGAAVAGAVAACADQRSATAPQGELAPSADLVGPRSSGAASGAVYVTTNAADGNAVVAFARMGDGSLAPAGTFATGGSGTGGTIDPLASQYAVILDALHRHLYAVDAGSSDIAVFDVHADGTLDRMQNIPSGGSTPVSLDVRGNRLYALNAGSNSVAAFGVGPDGRLTAISGGVMDLPAGAGGPAAVRVSADGRHLIVAERTANRIDVFPLGSDGLPRAGTTTPSSGQVPFGFDVSRGRLVVVSEAGTGSMSSYQIGRGGALKQITMSFPTGLAAACWVRNTRDGRFTYTTDAGSDAISGFAIGGDGSLVPLTADNRTGVLPAGSTPLDLDISADGRYLYTLNAGTGAVGAFRIGHDGQLQALAVTSGAVTAAGGAQGLAAW